MATLFLGRPPRVATRRGDGDEGRMPEKDACVRLCAGAPDMVARRETPDLSDRRGVFGRGRRDQLLTFK